MTAADAESGINLVQNLQLKKYADVILISSDNVKIYAHRLLLASYSTVFKSIFDEKKDEIPIKIDISNFTGDLVKQVINYIYNTNEVLKGEETNLLEFALEYGLHTVKVHTFQKISSDLTIHLFLG